jgi:hypothetical protein
MIECAPLAQAIEAIPVNTCASPSHANQYRDTSKLCRLPGSRRTCWTMQPLVPRSQVREEIGLTLHSERSAATPAPVSTILILPVPDT